MANTEQTRPIAAIGGLHHVRLTVTDIKRSMAFYTTLLGTEPAIDFTDEPLDSGVRDDMHRFFGGCTYAFKGQLLGLRPTATTGDRFDSTRVGLDHVSFGVASVADLHAAAERLDEVNVP